MTSVASRRPFGRRAAWAVPLAVSAAVAAGAVLPVGASADDHPNLPALTPAQLLTAVQASGAQAMSGQTEQTSKLGLPALPGSAGATSLTWQSLLTGSHTANVWVDGPDRQRLALLGPLAESEVVRSGQDVWTYASDQQAVTHLLLAAKGTSGSEVPDAPAMTPLDAANRALQAVDPTTSVTVDATARVAGRDAYTLVMAPKDSTSTVHRVAIAVDSATHVPLRVQIFGADATTPAFETSFSKVDFSRPAASMFRFTPPAGAAVTTRDMSTSNHPAGEQRSGESTTAEAKTHSAPSVVGQGWASVLVVPAGSAALAGGADGADRGRSTSAVLDRVATTLPDGDRLVQSTLLNVLLAKDGRVLIGAVSPGVLEQTAAG